LPCVHLDDWRRDEAGRVPRARLLQRAGEMATTGSWVAEGIYVTWTAPLMEAADLIVVLNPAAPILAYRIWRWRLSDPRQRRDHDLWSTVRFTWAAVRGYSWRALVISDANLPPSSRTFRQVLEPHAGRVVTIRRRAALDDLTRRLAQLE
jgi:hypothetical protein